MNISKFPRCAARPAAVIGLGFALASGLVIAQPVEITDGVNTVISPTGYRSPTTGAKIVEISMSRAVNVADLDLATVEGQREFRQRISTVARSLCDAINLRRPLPATHTTRRACIRKATGEALARVQFETGNL